MSTPIHPNLQEVLDLLDDERTRTSRQFRELSFRIKQIHDPETRRVQAEAVANICQQKYPRFGRFAFMVQCGLASARETDKDF